MKQIIILSLLLYYISCKNFCFFEIDVDKSQCFSYEPEDKINNQCCYIEVKSRIDFLPKLKFCISISKNLDKEDINKVFNENYKEYGLDENSFSIEDFKCKDS